MGSTTRCGSPQENLFRKHSSFMWDVLYEDKFLFNSVNPGTDLQDIPPRYFQGEEIWTARTFAYKLPTGFSSFAVSRNYEHLVPDMDFISDAENIKQLVKLPFSSDSVSLLMHRVGNSIFIDNYDLSMIFVPGYKDQWEWLSNFTREVTMKEKDTLMWEKRSAKHMLANDCLHKLFYYSLKEDLKFKSPTNTIDQNISATLDKNVREKCLEQPPETTLDGTHTSFLQKFSFEFLNLKFLLGSNVPVLQTRDKLLVTIRTNDLLESSFLPLYDCVDSWLDNTMLEAAESIVYHRKDSKVILTQTIRTDDMIKSNEANMVVEKSQKLFALLKDTVNKPGHTYWFYKAPGGELFDIYDVTACIKNDSKAPDANPVMPSIANLLYRICATSYTSLPPSSVLGMMKHFLYIYPEDNYPGLSLAALYFVLSSRLNSTIDVHKPQLKLMNGREDHKTDLSYYWENYSGPSGIRDILTLKYTDDDDRYPDWKFFNMFQNSFDPKKWNEVLSNTSDKSKAFPGLGPEAWAKIGKEDDKKPYELQNVKSYDKHSSIIMEFLPESINMPSELAILKDEEVKLEMERKEISDCEPQNPNTFSCHKAAYTAPIQKPEIPTAYEVPAQKTYQPKRSFLRAMQKRDIFLGKIKAKFPSKDLKEKHYPRYLLSTHKIPHPSDWAFFYTCKQLFDLFSSAFCMIEEVSVEKQKKKKQQDLEEAKVQKLNVTLLFREKLAILFLCIAHYAWSQSPCHTLLGRFCAKWAIFLNETGPEELTSMAWRIAGDLLAANLDGSDFSEGDFGKCTLGYENTIFKNNPDLDFLCTLSQGKRQINMIPHLKSYDANVYSTAGTGILTSMWDCYSQAISLATDAKLAELRTEITATVGCAVVDCCRSIQELLTTNDPLFYTHLQNQMEHIVGYFVSIQENWKCGGSELDSLRIQVYLAEANCLQDMRLVDKLNDKPNIEHLHTTFSEIYSKQTSTKDGQEPRLGKAIADEISWRLACNKCHIAKLMYDKLPVRSDWSISNQARTPSGPEYYTSMEAYLVTAVEIINKKDNLDCLMSYPTPLMQKVQLARTHNARGILNYTIARGCGWKPQNDPLKFEVGLTSYSLYEQPLAIPTDYERPDSVLKTIHDGGGDGDQGVTTISTHLERAEISFLAAAMLYHDLDCMSEFMLAYICYVDSKMGLFQGEFSNVILCEIQLLCNLRFYLKWNFNDKKPINARTVVDNEERIEPIIGSILHDRYRDDNFPKLVKPREPAYYIDLIWKKLLNLLGLLKKAGYKDAKKGESRGLDFLMKVPKPVANKPNETKTEDELRLPEFKKYLADVARVILREEMPIRQTDIPLPDSSLWQVKADGIDASGDGTYIEYRRCRSKPKRKGK